MADSETTLLVIDDDRQVHREVARQLDETFDQIWSAADPMEGIKLATQNDPTVILLDINLPKMDGLKVCRHLKEGPTTRDIPVIFLTVDRDVRIVAKALDCGGCDYVRKPFNELDLSARVRVALRSRRMIELLKEQARIDALTGLKNRAALEDALQAAGSAFDRSGQPFAVLMVDVDHFKEINDGQGHGVGDDVLRGIGDAIRSTCRPYDTACRYGGDEFALIFGHAHGVDAEHAANRMLAAIQQSSSEQRGGAFTASAGLASTESAKPPVDAKSLLELADEALYRAKQKGRGRLIIAGS